VDDAESTLGVVLQSLGFFRVLALSSASRMNPVLGLDGKQLSCGSHCPPHSS
jgi:hypothetical protein